MTRDFALQRNLIEHLSQIVEVQRFACDTVIVCVTRENRMSTVDALTAAFLLPAAVRLLARCVS